MKKLLILVSFFSIIISCKRDDSNQKTILFRFFIKNETSKNVKISFFYPNNELFKEISINSNDSILVDEGSLQIAPRGPSYNLTYSIDSAIIDFEDGKKIIQTIGIRSNNDTINNILLINNYKRYEMVNPNYVRKQFTVTTQDYLRAK